MRCTTPHESALPRALSTAEELVERIADDEALLELMGASGSPAVARMRSLLERRLGQLRAELWRLQAARISERPPHPEGLGAPAPVTDLPAVRRRNRTF